MRAWVISDALNVNGTLSNLDVSDNCIGCIGAAYLSEAVRVSRVKPVYNQGGARGANPCARSPSLDPKVRILILDIQV